MILINKYPQMSNWKSQQAKLHETGPGRSGMCTGNRNIADNPTFVLWINTHLVLFCGPLAEGKCDSSCSPHSSSYERWTDEPESDFSLTDLRWIIKTKTCYFVCHILLQAVHSLMVPQIYYEIHHGLQRGTEWLICVFFNIVFGQ